MVFSSLKRKVYILPNLRTAPSLYAIGLTECIVYWGSKGFILDTNYALHINIVFTSKIST